MAAVRRYCEAKVPAQLLAEVRVECEVRGRNITIVERRPPWDPSLGSEWTTQPVAQVRFDPSGNTWTLFFARSTGRWVRYQGAPVTPRIDELLSEIDEDPTGIFWG